VLAGSGTTPQSLAATLRRCSGAVVGTALKHPQTGRIERSRAVAYVEARRS
jgi:predicted TIM-barrel enzyme